MITTAIIIYILGVLAFVAMTAQVYMKKSFETKKECVLLTITIMFWPLAIPLIVVLDHYGWSP